MQVKRTLSHSIISNVSWNILGQGLLILITFFSTPYIVRKLGVDMYGIYTLTTVVVGYCAFLQLGLVHSIIKFIAQYFTVSDNESTRRAFWACIILYVGLGSFGAATLIAITPFLATKIFRFQPAVFDSAVLILRISALALPLTMLSAICNGVLRAVLRFDILNKIMIMSGILQIALAVILLALHYSLVHIVISYILLLTLTLAAYLFAVHKLMPYIWPPVWEPQVLKKMLAFGGFVTLFSITQPILENTEKIFLTSLRSVASLTYYYIPSTIVARLLIIPSSVLTVLFPVFSKYHGQNQADTNAELHYRSTLYMAYVYAFMLLLFYNYGFSFFELWIGTDFAKASTIILKILLIGGFINTLGLPSSTLLLGMGKPHLLAVFNTIEVLLYIPASYFMIKRFGTIGAAWAWVACTTLNTLLLNLFACRTLNVNTVVFHTKLLAALVIPASACAIGFILARHIDPSIAHPATIISTLILILLYLGAIYFAGLDDFARKKFKEYLFGRLKKQPV